MANSVDPEQKPTDLDLHYLLKQDIPGSAGLELRQHLEIYFLFSQIKDLFVYTPTTFCRIYKNKRTYSSEDDV